MQGGSSSNSGAVVPIRDLTWIKGQPKIWVKETGFISSFCDNCGSPVPNRLRELEFYWVPVEQIPDIDEFISMLVGEVQA